MNEDIVRYLQENKDKYADEILWKQLKQAGHNEVDIKTASDFVCGRATETKNGARVGSSILEKKEYQRRSEKVTDFLIGLLSPWIVSFGLFLVDDDLLFDLFWVVIAVYIVAMIATFRPRHYIFKGLYANLTLIGAIVVTVLSFFIMFKPNFF